MEHSSPPIIRSFACTPQLPGRGKSDAENRLLFDIDGAKTVLCGQHTYRFSFINRIISFQIVGKIVNVAELWLTFQAESPHFDSFSSSSSSPDIAVRVNILFNAGHCADGTHLPHTCCGVRHWCSGKNQTFPYQITKSPTIIINFIIAI